MKSSKLSIALSLVASLTTGLTVATAQFTAYTQSSAFFSALPGPSQTDTYESYDVNQEIFENGLLGSYTYSGFPIYDSGFLTGRIDNGFDFSDGPDYSGFISVAGGYKSLANYFNPTPSGTSTKDYFYSGTENNPGDSFTISVPTGTRAIGLFFNISSDNPPNLNDLFLSVAGVGTAFSGTNFDTTQRNNDGTNAGLGSFELLFVGLISDTPFTSVTIGSGTTPSETGNFGWNVDNLTTATPEPTSLCLLGFAVASLVGYSRKRNLA